MPTNIYTKAVIDTETDVAVGIKLPMDRADGGLFDLSYSTQEQAISNLKNLLLTNIGERIMQPTFGTAIQKYLFQPIQTIEFSNIRQAVVSAIQFWLPYIIVKECVVEGYNPNGFVNAEYGVLIYLLIRVTQNGANIPITLLYTNQTLRALDVTLAGDSLGGSIFDRTGTATVAGNVPAGYSTSQFNKVLTRTT